jgi:hypothetical protein
LPEFHVFRLFQNRFIDCFSQLSYRSQPYNVVEVKKYMQTQKIAILTIALAIVAVAAVAVTFTQLAGAQNSTQTQTPPSGYYYCPVPAGNGTDIYYCYPIQQGALPAPQTAAPYGYGCGGMGMCGRFR